MSTRQVSEVAGRLNRAGVPPEFGPDHSRVLIRAWRALARGRPISSAQVDQMVTGLAISADGAHQFLKDLSEYDSADNIVGIFGLSLNKKWRHRFRLDVLEAARLRAQRGVTNLEPHRRLSRKLVISFLKVSGSMKPRRRPRILPSPVTARARGMAATSKSSTTSF